MGHSTRSRGAAARGIEAIRDMFTGREPSPSVGRRCRRNPSDQSTIVLPDGNTRPSFGVKEARTGRGRIKRIIVQFVHSVSFVAGMYNNVKDQTDKRCRDLIFTHIYTHTYIHTRGHRPT